MFPKLMYAITVCSVTPPSKGKGESAMAEHDQFYTLKGYARLEKAAVTSAMEDYLEMIYRIQMGGEPVRIGTLAAKLNVKPSSASKMVGNLKNQGFAASEKYGYVTLTETGNKLGKYLVFRHDTLHRFLCHLNQSENELEQVEKIEHFINAQTVENMRKMLDGV